MWLADQVFFAQRFLVWTDEIEAVGGPVSYERRIIAEGCVCIHKAFLVVAHELKRDEGNHNQVTTVCLLRLRLKRR